MKRETPMVSAARREKLDSILKFATEYVTNYGDRAMVETEMSVEDIRIVMVIDSLEFRSTDEFNAFQMAVENADTVDIGASLNNKDMVEVGFNFFAKETYHG